MKLKVSLWIVLLVAFEVSALGDSDAQLQFSTNGNRFFSQVDHSLYLRQPLKDGKQSTSFSYANFNQNSPASRVVSNEIEVQFDRNNTHASILQPADLSESPVIVSNDQIPQDSSQSPLGNHQFIRIGSYEDFDDFESQRISKNNRQSIRRSLLNPMPVITTRSSRQPINNRNFQRNSIHGIQTQVRRNTGGLLVRSIEDFDSREDDDIIITIPRSLMQHRQSNSRGTPHIRQYQRGGRSSRPQENVQQILESPVAPPKETSTNFKIILDDSVEDDVISTRLFSPPQTPVTRSSSVPVVAEISQTSTQPARPVNRLIPRIQTSRIPKQKLGVANYKFGYEVYGDGAGHGHKEERKSERVEGEYFVDLPNGLRQIVKYYADETGYHPTITYEKRNDFDIRALNQHNSGTTQIGREITFPDRRFGIDSKESDSKTSFHSSKSDIQQTRRTSRRRSSQRKNN